MRTVFLSSTARDLSAYRDAAYRAIEGLDGFQCVRMEDFGARAELPDAFCRQKIAACDVAVFLVGLCWGSAPKGSDKSYTMQEYEAARAAKVPTLVFLTEEENYPGFYRESEEARTAQQGFRARVSAEVIRGVFTTPDDLAAKVCQSLSNWRRITGAASDTPFKAFATLGGSGAIAQEGAVAAGAGGVAIGGDVAGDVVAGGGKKEIHVHCSPSVADAVSKIVYSELDPILLRRVIVPERSRAEIRSLWHRLNDDRDLSLAGPEARSRVLYWAARLHASQEDTVAQAIEYADCLQNAYPTEDARIIDGWLQATKGDSEAALRIVRDIDTPDGRANLFALLRHCKGDRDALDWLESQEELCTADLLTGVGWHNVAAAFLNAKQWEDALGILELARPHLEACPTLALTRGHVESLILLPEPVRGDALETAPFLMEVATLEGRDADHHRDQALQSFRTAIELLEPLNLVKQVQFARLMVLWLRLSSSHRDVAEEAQREVADLSADGRRAAEVLPLVRHFNIEFDFAPVGKYLEGRERLGGLGPQEILAEYFLGLLTMRPGDLAALIEQNEQRFESVFRRSHLTSRRIEALAEDKQLARAKALLEDRKADFSETEYERLRTLVDIHAGEDIRARAEELYEHSGSWTDLHNLIRVLERCGDWAAARPLLEELFRLERTQENAERLVRCLQKLSPAEDAAVVSFLDANRDVVVRSLNLASAEAWSYFRMGRWREADEINQNLLKSRIASEDFFLDTNLALQAGDWGRFPVIVDRETPRCVEHDPATLLRLATLAAESDATEHRAMDFAKMAAEKAPEDPNILVNAWSLACQLGQEDEADPRWLTRAAELSSDSGPVWQVGLRKIAEEFIPAHRERTEKIEGLLLRGEIPLHFVAKGLNIPLSNILLELPRRNAMEADGRKRSIIPVFSGARQPVDVQPNWVVGLDITTILLLSHLDLLQKVLKSLYRCALTPDVMLFLLSERRRAQFHQPSRVRKAEEVRSELDRGRLHVEEVLPTPPNWLSREIGRNLAQLLVMAKEHGGRVVHPLPVYKLSSLHEERASLQEYERLILTTVAFARHLRDRGEVDVATYERAHTYLKANGLDAECQAAEPALDGTVYLSHLALTYIQDSGLLPSLCMSDLDIRVHPAARAEQTALIEANRDGRRLASSLDSIRQTLRSALVSGRAFLLPWRHGIPDEQQDEGDWVGTPALNAFLDDVTPCDAVSVDDRFANRHPVLTDRKNRTVPLLCTLDLIRFLESQRAIPAAERLEHLHRLREGCFGLVPISKSELEARLGDAQLNPEGNLQTTPELKAIRYTLARVRSLDMLQQPLETPFLDRLRLDCIQVLYSLWRNRKRNLGEATILTDWIWKNVAPSPLDWYRTARGKQGLRPVTEAFGNHVALLLAVSMSLTNARQEAFRAWLETEVLARLLPANPDLLDRSLPLLEDAITVCANDV